MTPAPHPASQSIQGSRRKPAQYSVKISIADGHLVYTDNRGKDATTLKVFRGDTIVWQSDHGNYSILFKTNTPFNNVGYHGHRGMPSDEAKVIGVKDEYHYAVVVIPDGGKPITDDPVIIVDDGD